MLLLHLAVDVEEVPTLAPAVLDGLALREGDVVHLAVLPRYDDGVAGALQTAPPTLQESALGSWHTWLTTLKPRTLKGLSPGRHRTAQLG